LAQPETPLVGHSMAMGWIALAAQAIAGVPEQAFYGGSVAALWLLTRRTGLGLCRRIGRILFLAAGALALAAPQLLPTAYYLPTTWRAEAPVLYDLGSLWLTDPTALLLPTRGLLNGFYPTFFGVATLVLAVAGMVSRRRGAMFLGVTGLIAFLLALGP